MADEEPASTVDTEDAPSAREMRSRKRAAPVRPPVRPRKRVKSAATVVEDESEPGPEPEPAVEPEIVDNGLQDANEEEEAGETEEEKRAKLENHEIDPSTLSMFELSHDSRHGKTSEREKKMAQIDWKAVKRKRIEEADAIARGDTRKDKSATNAVSTTEHDVDEEGESSTQAEPVTRAMGGGVRFRVVNGEIVEEVDSLTIDRAARLVEANENADEPIEEENDLTVRFNRTTYINARKRDETERVPMWRSKSDAWSEEETDRFYEALRMFGTDFFIISKMFPPKTRKQIKLKFIREERLEPQRINDTLLGKRTGKIDLDQYAQAIDRDVADFHKYDSLAHANEVIRASMADKEEAMRAAVKEDEENNRQREVQRQQREKQRLEAERKKEERARKKDARRRGNVWGTGTLAGADDDGPDGD